MEIIDYLLAKKKAGGGSDVTIEQLTATENGTYSEQGKAYSPVVVNVPTPENSYQLKDLPSGTVSTIDDGTNLPMPSLKIGIEPQQDLHGYDHPWAGGAGKNKLQVTATSQTVDGITFTINNDGTINVNGTAIQDISLLLSRKNVSDTPLPEGQLTMTGCPSGGSTSSYYLTCWRTNSGNANDVGSGVTFGYRSDWDFAVFLVIASGTTCNNLIFKPMIRLATETDATFAPYSNICPISGWTAANVNVSPTTSAEDGTTYTIQFRDGDNPLTVYGGTLDVTTGELIVDRKSVDMGDLSWAYDISYNRFASDTIPDTEAPSGARVTSFISSMYEVVSDGRPVSQITSGQMYSSFNSARTNAIVMVHDNRFTDAALFRNAVSGQTFIYELAEPITYHLTPTQIRTLVGNNNIWADTGNIIEGKYFKSLT